MFLTPLGVICRITGRRDSVCLFGRIAGERSTPSGVGVVPPVRLYKHSIPNGIAANNVFYAPTDHRDRPITPEE